MARPRSVRRARMPCLFARAATRTTRGLRCLGVEMLGWRGARHSCPCVGVPPPVLVLHVSRASGSETQPCYEEPAPTRTLRTCNRACEGLCEWVAHCNKSLLGPICCRVQGHLLRQAGERARWWWEDDCPKKKRKTVQACDSQHTWHARRVATPSESIWRSPVLRGTRFAG